MYYDLFVKRDRHWRAVNPKPTNDRKRALKDYQYMKGYNAEVVLVVSSTNPRMKDSALRFVVSLMRDNHAGKAR